LSFIFFVRYYINVC